MKKQIFKSKAKPNQLVEFKVDDNEPNKIGFILAITFDGCNQVFYTIQDMYSDERGACHIFEGVDEKDIVRILPEEEDFEESIKKLMEAIIKENSDGGWQDKALEHIADAKETKITRFEVIDSTSRVYVNNQCEIELSYQDDGKTLKVFVK